MSESRSLGSLIVRLVAEGLGAYKGAQTEAAGATEKTAKAMDESAAAAGRQRAAFEKSTAVTQGLVDAAKMLAGSWAVLKTLDLARDAAMASARFETMGVVMRVAGNNAGYTMVQMQGFEKQLQANGISMLQSRNTLTQLATANIDLASASKLARAAQDVAVVGNVNSSEALGRLVDGIKSGEVEVLKSLGLNVSFEGSYKKLAAQLGTTSDKLTEQQKVLARTNVALEEAARYTGIYEESMSTAGKQMKSMERYTEDLSLMMGEVFNESLTVAVMGLVNVLKDGNKEVTSLAKNDQLKTWGNDVAETFAFVVDSGLSAVAVLKTAGSTAAYLAASAKNSFFGSSISDPGGGVAQRKAAQAAIDETYQSQLNGIFNSTHAMRDALAQRRKALADDQAQRAVLDEKEKGRIASGRSSRDAADAAAAAALKDAAAAKAHTEAVKKATADAASALAFYNDLMDAASGFTKSYAEDQNKLALALRTGAISSYEDYALAVQRLMDKQPAMQAAEKLRLELAKENTKAVDDLFDAQEKLRLANEDQIKTGRTLLEQIEFDTRLLGLNAEQRAIATMERELEAKGIIKGTQAYDAYIAKLREAMSLKVGKEEGIKAADDLATANQKAAEESAKYWEDALMRAFESGKGFFQSLWDTIKNTLKTQVLKVTVQGVMGSLGIGAAGAAMAGDTGGGNMLGVAGNLSSVYNVATSGIAASVGVVGNAAVASIQGMIGMTGTAAQAATAAANGVAFAATGSGSMLASIGAAAPYALAAVAAVALIKGLFSESREITAQGTQGTFSGAAFAGQNYTTTKVDPGFFSKTYHTTDYSAMEAKMAQAWTDAFAVLKTGAATAATTLGLATDKITAYSKTVDIAAGTTAEQMTAIFTGMADDMATAAAPGLAALARVGETSSTTLSRLASSLSTANQWLGVLDHSLLAVSLTGGDLASSLADTFGGLDKLATASKAYYDSFWTDAERLADTTTNVAKGLALVGQAMPDTLSAFRSVVSGLDLTTEAGRNTYAVMLALAPEFATTVAKLTDLAKAHTDLADQYDKLTLSTEAYRAKTMASYTAQEQAQAKANFALEDSITAYKAQAEATKAAGEALIKVAADMRDAMASAGGNIASLIKDLSAGANLDPMTQMRSTQGTYLADLAGARSGDLKASERIAASARAYIDASSAVSSSPRQAATVAQIVAELGKLPATKTYEEKLLEAVGATTTAVTDLHGKFVADLTVNANSEISKLISFATNTDQLPDELKTLALAQSNAFTKTVNFLQGSTLSDQAVELALVAATSFVRVYSLVAGTTLSDEVKKQAFAGVSAFDRTINVLAGSLLSDVQKQQAFGVASNFSRVITVISNAGLSDSLMQQAFGVVTSASRTIDIIATSNMTAPLVLQAFGLTDDISRTIEVIARSNMTDALREQAFGSTTDLFRTVNLVAGASLSSDLKAQAFGVASDVNRTVGLVAGATLGGALKAQAFDLGSSILRTVELAAGASVSGTLKAWAFGSGAVVQRTLELTVGSSLSEAMKAQAFGLGSDINRALQVTLAADLTDDTKHKAFDAGDALSRTLSLAAYTGNAALFDQAYGSGQELLRQIALAESSSMSADLKTLAIGQAKDNFVRNLVVTGTMTDDQRAVLGALTGTATKTLIEVVTGADNLTAAQKEVMFAGSSWVSKTLDTLVVGGAFTEEQYRIWSAQNTTASKTLDTLVIGGGMTADQRRVINESYSYTQKVLDAIVIGGTVSADQLRVLNQANEAVSKTIYGTVDISGLTASQQTLLAAINGGTSGSTVTLAGNVTMALDAQAAYNTVRTAEHTLRTAQAVEALLGTIGAGTPLGGYMQNLWYLANNGGLHVKQSGTLGAFAHGGAFTNSVVSSPTLFDMGLMGEVGPEAIMPLSRTSSGDLGVQVQMPDFGRYGRGNGDNALAAEIRRLSQVNERLEKRLEAIERNTGVGATYQADTADTLRTLKNSGVQVWTDPTEPIKTVAA